MSDAAIADRRLHPATTIVRLVKDLPSAALGIPAAFAFLSDAGWGNVLLVAVAVVTITLAVNWLLWRRFRYGIGAGGIVIESGLLNRTRRSIPFERIQDVDIERGPFHRLLGLAKVRIETGGSASDEGVLDSVGLGEADRLRAAIRAGRSEARHEVEAVPAADPEPRTVFAMDVRRLLLSGLFNFSFLYLAALFAALQTFEPWLPFDIYDPGRWLGLVGATTGSVGAVSFLLLVALLLGVVTGVVRTVARDFGFRLLAEPERFRRERGLLTRSEVVVAKPRIQLALRRTGPIRRRFGWHALLFQTLSAGKEGAGHQSVAPFAHDGEIAAVLAESGGFHAPDPAALTIVSSGYVWRKLISNLLVPLVAIVAASLFWLPALGFFVLLPLFAAKPFVERRFHRYALAGELLFVQRGVWRQTLWMVPVASAQAVSIRRSWLQRRLGIATLLIDTAGASQLNDPRIVDIRLDTAREIAAALTRPGSPAHSGRKSGTER